MRKLAAVLVAAWLLIAATGHVAAQARQVARIVSIVPAATEMLFAVGAGPQVVAVGSYDDYPPQVKGLPRVGALLDPDVERILSLRPDLVVLFHTQTDLAAKLRQAHIGVFDYRQGGLADVLDMIRGIGAATGHGPEGDAVAGRITRELDGIRHAVSGLPRPRTLLVFGHERQALRGIYASGGVGFLNDMLEAAGGENVFADVHQESVQATTEQILARRPDVILEIRASDSAMPHGDLEAEIATWNALPSVPAVRTKRVYFLIDDRLVVPGPRIAGGTRLLAHALHPDAVK